MTCFLVMIAPLITISYSIDKIGNNRSEILNQWLKEFCYNVLIQPFHCIVYLVFVDSAVKNLTENAQALNFGAMIQAIIYMLCIFIGEKLIRQIFGFTKSKSVASKLFSGAMITQAVKDVKQIRSYNKAEDSEEEETEAPPLMPGGTPTNQAMIKAKSQRDLDKIQGENEKQDSKTSMADKVKRRNNENEKSGISSANDLDTISTNKRSRIKNTIQKVQDHTPTIMRDAGRAYISGVKTVTGINAVQRHTEKNKHKPKPKTKYEMSEFRKQFLVASDDYAKNNGLTKQQLGWKIEEIRKTSFEKLENSEDRIYKLWIDKMDKDLTKHGASERASNGRDDTVQAMKDFMDDNYET